MGERKKPPNAGKGRVAGVPNRLTADARQAFSDLLNGSIPRMQAWLDRVATSDPGRALDTVLKLAEFCIPRLGRIEHTGELTHKHTREMSDAELTSIAAGGSAGAADTAQGEDPDSSVH
jgi:hypothetical protein